MADNKLRIVYMDQAHTVTAEDADRLSLGGLGRPAGSRLFDNPELRRQIFLRRPRNELDLILSSAAGSRRAIEFGTGTGHLLLPLHAVGLEYTNAAVTCCQWTGPYDL